MKTQKINFEGKPALFSSTLVVGHHLCPFVFCCFYHGPWCVHFFFFSRPHPWRLVGVSVLVEALLLSPGFSPPREALLWSSGFRPPREAGAASMMPRLPAGVGPYV